MAKLAVTLGALGFFASLIGVAGVTVMAVSSVLIFVGGLAGAMALEARDEAEVSR